MSEGYKKAIWFLIGFYCAQLAVNYINSTKIVDLETRITALEQSQCAVKESKDHADYKLEACMKQLVKK